LAREAIDRGRRASIHQKSPAEKKARRKHRRAISGRKTKTRILRPEGPPNDLLRADANEVVGKNFLETSPMRRNSPDA
jgi:hypothetical protein